MNKYYVFTRLVKVGMYTYPEVITCKIDLTSYTFRRIIDLSGYLNGIGGLALEEETYCGESFVIIDREGLTVNCKRVNK